jgi:hypothetical protein
MQKNVVIQLYIGNATGRKILARVLKRIKDSDKCTIRITCDNDDFRRLSSSASALIADTSADIEMVQATIDAGKPVVLLNDWRIKNQPSNHRMSPNISRSRERFLISDSAKPETYQSAG